MALNDFAAFAKGRQTTKEINGEVWLYTRVSSKDQEANRSLENQKEAGYKYAAEAG